MKNKAAKQSALDVYSDVFLSAPINSPKYFWAFDRLRNAECSWSRSPNHMRHGEIDKVSVKAEDLK